MNKPVDPRAVAARKSREREAWRYIGMRDAAVAAHEKDRADWTAERARLIKGHDADAQVVKRDLCRAQGLLRRSERLHAAETFRANAWRDKARTLRAKNRRLMKLLGEAAALALVRSIAAVATTPSGVTP